MSGAGIVLGERSHEHEADDMVAGARLLKSRVLSSIFGR